MNYMNATGCTPANPYFGFGFKNAVERKLAPLFQNLDLKVGDQDRWTIPANVLLPNGATVTRTRTLQGYTILIQGTVFEDGRSQTPSFTLTADRSKRNIHYQPTTSADATWGYEASPALGEKGAPVPDPADQVLLDLVLSQLQAGRGQLAQVAYA